MDTTEILAQIDKEIASLQQARAILLGTHTRAQVGRLKQVKIESNAAAPTKRGMSVEGKARVAAAQKARWAKVRKAAKKAAKI